MSGSLVFGRRRGHRLTACLGDIRLEVLHRAGWLDEHVPDAVARAGALLWGDVAPWCNTWF